jgi:hypothetical protein
VSKHCVDSALVCVEIGVVYDMSRAYEGNCPRCGLEGIISGMISNSGSKSREAM